MWEEVRKIMREDRLEAKKNKKFERITFDLEKALPLPRIPTNIVFYKRQLWLYKAGIHSSRIVTVIAMFGSKTKQVEELKRSVLV